MAKTRRKRNYSKHKQRVHAARKKRSKESCDAERKAERDLRAAAALLKRTSGRYKTISAKLSELERALRGER